ncbi:MAG: hypothetical protein HY749_05605 [Gammaproteobacteria bacterium]|nr:hypothetical protein [Gammaproteobacteria bacterium]MBI5615909.1 hypothetical protein [Gammaproteobacteria bacterium]
MTRRTFVPAAVLAAGSCLFLSAASAAESAEYADIKRQIAALKSDYEGRIATLEQRLAAAERTARAAEAKAAAAEAGATQAAVVAPLPAPAPAASASAFNPAISGVLMGTLGANTRNPDTQHISGFAPAPGTEFAPRGFSLGESELVFAASIDQTLTGQLVLAVAPDDTIAVEEAYVQSSSLPWGFTVKAGRFFSGIGYLNEKHAHAWDFVDAPLPYVALLGTQFGDDGVQLRWVAPTDTFLEFGAEAFRGDAFPAGNGPNHGLGAGSVFVHTGGDIGESASWLAGLSYLQTRASDRETDGDLFSGRDHLAIASLVYKWAPLGNPTVSNLVLNGEYLYDRNEGRFDGLPLRATRDGWYLQGVYQFMPRWRVGFRHDEVDAGDVPASFAGTVLDAAGHTPRRDTALLEFDTSEFARWRLQYTHDDSDARGGDAVQLNYNVTFGPHGAHRF